MNKYLRYFAEILLVSFISFLFIAGFLLGLTAIIVALYSPVTMIAIAELFGGAAVDIVVIFFASNFYLGLGN